MEKLTLYFNKRTGEIKEMCSGARDMSIYGDEEQDYKLIIGYLVIDYDDYVFQNYYLFKIEDGKIKLKNDSGIQKYL